MMGVTVRGNGGDCFLTLHSISYTTSVIICDCYSKGWLGSGEGYGSGLGLGLGFAICTLQASNIRTLHASSSLPLEPTLNKI